MKASEVLAQYRKGKRDFQGINLQGQSFMGKDLAGADFSGADIRGTNFLGAILRETKFCRARAGLPQKWMYFLLVVCLLLGVGGSILLAFAGFLAAYFFNPSDLNTQVFSGTILIATLFYYSLIFWLGLEWETIGVLVGAFVPIYAFLFLTSQAGVSVPNYFFAAISFLFVSPFLFASIFTGVFVFAVASVGASITAGIKAEAVIGLGVLALVGFFARASAVIPEIGTKAGGFIVVLAVALGGMFFSCYVGGRAMRGDPRTVAIRRSAVALAAAGGTIFHGADLTDADFAGAVLANTDFQSSNLTRTRFKNSVKLSFARPGNTILANPAVRELLSTGKGARKDYTDANLRGANLVRANLGYATLKRADLTDATLEYANLEGANLCQVKAVGTNFGGVSFTAACIEAWHIDSSTVLDLDCLYLYLLEYPKPKTDDRERRPSHGEFSGGEFMKLFAQRLNTIDLIFRNGIDWNAFVTAFQQVQVENQETYLEIQGIENKGDGVMVVKVNVAPDTDKETIQQEFTENYTFELIEVEGTYQARLDTQKNALISFYRQQSTDMMEILEYQASKPIEAYGSKTYSQKGRAKQVAIFAFPLLIQSGVHGLAALFLGGCLESAEPVAIFAFPLLVQNGLHKLASLFLEDDLESAEPVAIFAFPLLVGSGLSRLTPLLFGSYSKNREG